MHQRYIMVILIFLPPGIHYLQYLEQYNATSYFYDINALLDEFMKHNIDRAYRAILEAFFTNGKLKSM